ncbi:T9SS type A sorting domain-containing protein [candidate division KSB1 bacterium]|nr:T9SS type A sorting domain-containing protein [candidate division KSB1 bacterium]
MKRFLSLLIIMLVVVHLSLHAEILKESRRIDWEAGIPHAFPIPEDTVDIFDYAAYGDGENDDGPAFQDAIDDLGTWGGVVWIPEGIYLINQTLTINHGVILAGEGADRSDIQFDLEGASDNCIEILTYDYGNESPVLSGCVKGSQKLVVANPEYFTQGAFVEIYQNNDPDLMYTDSEWDQSWAQEALGQIIPLEGISGDTLLLQNALYHDYNPDLNPVIRTLGMVQHAGIEKLHLERLDAGDGHTVLIKNAAYCRFQFNESEMGYRAHFYFDGCFRCELRRNYIHHSHDYGGGGHGYGTDNIGHTTGNLIIDNVFHHLRHSMMVHVGATGNVFAYNYSSERANGLCDISLHGHWPNNNLFESNVVEQIDVSDYWGPCGPRNTFLRNRVTIRGINVRDHSDGQNTIGNVLNTGVGTSGPIADLLEHGNVRGSNTTWDDTIPDHDIPASYFLSDKPDFWGDVSWPAVGPDVENEIKIPAQLRWEAGSPLTSITDQPYRYVGLSQPDDFELSTYPNPFNPMTTISYLLSAVSCVTLDVVNLRGRLIQTLVHERQLPGKHTIRWDGKNNEGQSSPSGIYVLRLRTPEFKITKKITILK